jgi:hypothetical protein
MKEEDKIVSGGGNKAFSGDVRPRGATQLLGRARSSFSFLFIVLFRQFL